MITIYIIAAFIRLYPNDKFGNCKLWGILCFCSIVLSIGSILMVDFLGVKYGFTNYNHLLSLENKLLALSNVTCLFMAFNNYKMKPSKRINLFASATFGVLLIHANSSCMMKFPWENFLQNMEWYSSSWVPLHWLLSVVSIYLICSCIDLLCIVF